MITPGGNPYCKHCKQLMHPGVNYCETGVCMCGEDIEHHYASDHMPVDSGGYNKLECERDDDHTRGAETLDEVSDETRKRHRLDD